MRVSCGGKLANAPASLELAPYHWTGALCLLAALPFKRPGHYPGLRPRQPRTDSGGRRDRRRYEVKRLAARSWRRHILFFRIFSAVALVTTVPVQDQGCRQRHTDSDYAEDNVRHHGRSSHRCSLYPALAMIKPRLRHLGSPVSITTVCVIPPHPLVAQRPVRGSPTASRRAVWHSHQSAGPAAGIV